MKSTKIIVMAMASLMLLATACDQDETSEVTPQEEQLIHQESNLQASTLVEQGSFKGWFDQVTLTQGEAGALNMKLEGQVNHQSNAALLTYSEVFQIVDSQRTKVFTTDLHPTEDRFNYSLSLPADYKHIADKGGRYEIVTFAQSNQDQEKVLNLKTLYLGSQEAIPKSAITQPSSSGRTSSNTLTSSIDIVHPSIDDKIRLAGWTCKYGVNTNNIDVFAKVYRLDAANSNQRIYVGQSNPFRANLNSGSTEDTQAIQSICNTNLSHRFDFTFDVELTSGNYEIDIFGLDYSIYGPPAPDLIGTRYFPIISNGSYCFGLALYDDVFICTN